MVVDALSATLSALADPTRRAILSRLAEGPATVGELVGRHRMTQQAVSKHVACLERARLVRKFRDGRRAICALRGSAMKDAALWLEPYRRFWEGSFDRLEEYLRTLKKKEKNHGRQKKGRRPGARLGREYRRP
jgi:DNA-binding transcriptional ArsR family regulator